MSPTKPIDADAPALLNFLSARDVPCPICSHGLRGITAPVCPECGSPLRLDVTSANLHLGPWSMVMVSLALGMGFDGVVSILFGTGLTYSLLFERATPGRLYQPLTIFGTIAGLGLLSALAMFGFARRRRAWRRLPVRRQWRIAVLTFIAVGIVHAAGGAGLVLWFSRK